MKNLLPIGVSTCIGLALLSETCQAGLSNGSFELWTLRGWTVELPHGTSENEPLDRTAGQIRLVDSWGDKAGFAAEHLPHDGYRFAQLSTRGNANFIGDDTYNFFLGQSVHLVDGQSLSGWSFFFNGDPTPQDSAWVRIFDQSGNELATPWLEGLGAATSTAATPLTATDWMHWNWEAPEAGLYTVRLGMTTRGDNNGASYAGFDGLAVHMAAPVPEPGILALGALGAVLMTRLRARKN
jgi:hypothetical protein